jgi:branched-chain amino acid transport system ATP-binding protein
VFEAKSITLHYGKIRALKGVSVKVGEGTIVTLIGANGAGKSSTLMAISGLRRLVSGEIWFNGERIDGLAPHKIVTRGIAQVPEARRVFPDMTVLENLEMGAYLRKDRREMKLNLEEVFRDFPVLVERKTQRAGTLSGGEQQMLAVARALMARPELLLMDEPTLGLSPLMVGAVSRIVRRIHQKGIRVLLVEQNARMALKLAQYGYVLESGEIALEGASETLMGHADVKRAYLGK